jgi:flagellar basal body-associated protein FliL
MHWRALDIIKKNKRSPTSPLDISRVDSKTDFLDGIFSKEEKLAAEDAISQLSKAEQEFFADCIDDISYDDLVKKYLPKETDVEKAKVALRQRKTRLRNRLRQIVNSQAFVESAVSAQTPKPALHAI